MLLHARVVEPLCAPVEIEIKLFDNWVCQTWGGTVSETIRRCWAACFSVGPGTTCCKSTVCVRVCAVVQRTPCLGGEVCENITGKYHASSWLDESTSTTERERVQKKLKQPLRKEDLKMVTLATYGQRLNRCPSRLSATMVFSNTDPMDLIIPASSEPCPLTCTIVGNP